MPAAERGPRSFVVNLSSPPALPQARHRKRPAVIDVKHVVPMTLLVQTCVSFVVAAVSWIWAGEVAGTSALLGGAAAVVPNGFLAARVLKPNRDTSARAMMRAAWIGEIGGDLPQGRQRPVQGKAQDGDVRRVLGE